MYLGLVLAGAAPQVLANAALSKQFNVRDEIEFKDDLDNKPDGERSSVSESVKIYLEDVEYFLSSLARLQKRGKFDVTKDTFDVVQTTLLPCIDSNLSGRYTPVRFDSTSDDARPALSYFSRGMVYGYSLGDCIPNTEFKPDAVDSQFSFKLDAKDFAVFVCVKKDSPQRAYELMRELAIVQGLYSAKDNSKLREQIIEHTVFGSAGNQVRIILRLPRGSLETLLADAK